RGPRTAAGLPSLASERGSARGLPRLAVQRPVNRSRALARGLAASPRRTSGVRGATPGLRLRAALGRWAQLHAGASGLAEPDRDRLLRRPGPVLALADVMHLFTDELAGLAGGPLAFALGLARSLERFLFGHDYLSLRVPHRKNGAGDFTLPQPSDRTQGSGGHRRALSQQGLQIWPETFGDHAVARRVRMDAVGLVQPRVGGHAVEEE